MSNQPQKDVVVHGRNGYEIRADILKLAKEMLSEEFEAKYRTWSESVSRASDGTILDTSNAPSYPNTDDVLVVANNLYSFVNFNKNEKTR